jgi:glycosyltransferase involved in cell wall biosynthesis
MDLVYIGRYNKDDILSGPEKVARRVFDNISKTEKAIFIEYYFDGKKYGLLKKIFGKEIIDCVNGCDIIRVGMLTLFFTLTKIKPKIIHIITFERFAFVSFIYKMFFRVKIVYNLHGLMVYENKNFRKQNWYYDLKDRIAEKIFIKYSDIILLLSKSFNNLLDTHYKIKENGIRYIRNGADSECHIAGTRKIFNENNILKVVFIADVQRKEKGFQFLKKSLEMIENKIELYVVDNKDNTISFNNDLIKVFCSDKMSTAELADYLIDKDIFISASNYEPFSITTVECMAAGVIPVLTKETGASELIEDGKNGFLFDYGDSKKLIDILNELLENKELRKNVSKKAIEIYYMVSWVKISNDYLNIYKSIGN